MFTGGGGVVRRDAWAWLDVMRGRGLHYYMYSKNILRREGKVGIEGREGKVGIEGRERWALKGGKGGH